MRVLGYVRVSTDEQDTGLEAQRFAILAECEKRDWTIERIRAEKVGAASLVNRPQLQFALNQLECGEADVLMVAKLDRLSRSVADFAGLMGRGQKEGWAIVCLDIGVDTTTPGGELVANVLAAVSQWERKLIGARTKEALAVKKANGVKLGRPRTLDKEVRDQIIEGISGRRLSYGAMARELNALEVPTAHGGKKWYPETVRGIVMGEGG
jgi:DNA invertase Pin-like site-specific DNA recombinase